MKTQTLKRCLFLLIFSFMMFYSPHLLMSDVSNEGNLTGFIYGEDETTPLEGGIVKIINISTGTVYESTKSDVLGVFMIEGIEGGLYIATISTSEGDFKVTNFIGIETSETAKVSFALEVMEGHEEGMPPVGVATVIASSDPIMYNSAEFTEVEEEEEEEAEEEAEEAEEEAEEAEEEAEEAEEENEEAEEEEKEVEEEEAEEEGEDKGEEGEDKGEEGEEEGEDKGDEQEDKPDVPQGPPEGVPPGPPEGVPPGPPEGVPPGPAVDPPEPNPSNSDPKKGE